MQAGREFDGQVILVTGSASGIGREVAEQLTARGAKVVVNSVTSVEAGRELASSLDGLYLQADVSLQAEADLLVEESVRELGRLDHVINNAGTTRVIAHSDFEALTEEVWRTILDTNLLGTFWVSRAALPHLKESSGSILNITSVAGLRQAGSCVPYAVSKAAINHLTRLMANQVGPEVRVNAVAPGLIETPWTKDWKAQHERVARVSPMGRSGTPRDVALACIGVLLSPYTTGEVFTADGGVRLMS